MTDHHQRLWRRNQMEAALWRYFATYENWGGDWSGLTGSIPSVFTSRIKKMLNMDRIPGMTPWDGLPEDRWVFYDEPGEGTGSEDRFSAVHAFLMAVALDLLNIGLKQSEVIFFLKHTRTMLEGAFDRIHRRPGAIAPVMGSGRQLRFARHYPEVEPIWIDPHKAPRADFTGWLVVRRFETREIHPGFEKQAKNSIPFFMEPKFLFGLEAVKNEVFSHLNGYRHMVALELADPALTIPQYLADAPSVGRGRPPIGNVREIVARGTRRTGER